MKRKPIATVDTMKKIAPLILCRIVLHLATLGGSALGPSDGFVFVDGRCIPGIGLSILKGAIIERGGTRSDGFVVVDCFTATDTECPSSLSLSGVSFVCL